MRHASATKVGFVFQEALGHKTHASNLRRALAAHPDIAARWYHPDDYERVMKKIPVMRASWRLHLALAGYLALRPSAHTLAAALFHTQDVSQFSTGIMRRLPSVVSLDATHLQLQAFGVHYGGGPGSPRMEALKMRLYAGAYAAARRLVTWSQWAKDSLVADFGVPPDKVRVIPPGVDTALFRPDASARPGDGVTRLLFVGGDFGRKGGDLLLRWARETRVGAPWELHLVTRDDVPGTPGVVAHRGVANNSPELVRLYQRSDLFVLPTRADCFSLVSMEAMACGLPVVTSRLGGIPELIRGGETGLLTEPGDFGALAGHLDRLVCDAALRQGMGQAAQEQARTHYSLDNYTALLDFVRDTARSA